MPMIHNDIYVLFVLLIKLTILHSLYRQYYYYIISCDRNIMYVCAYNLREQSITIACAIGHKNKLLSTIQIKLLLKIKINDNITNK